MIGGWTLFIAAGTHTECVNLHGQTYFRKILLTTRLLIREKFAERVFFEMDVVYLKPVTCNRVALFRELPRQADC